LRVYQIISKHETNLISYKQDSEADVMVIIEGNWAMVGTFFAII